MNPTSSPSPLDVGHEYIEVLGAHEHNLQEVNIDIPRNQLVVITGISGSGKSSLAFDTLYAEGRRRYLESFSAYARGLMGGMERPEVDRITGLSPVIAIEQKTTTHNPRSTVGTTTEIYDFLRLLYARVGEAFSHTSGLKMERRTEAQIVETILETLPGKTVTLLAPLVRGRKGHYRELFLQIQKRGYTRARVDGVLVDLKPKMQVDRFKIHDIEMVVDCLSISPKERVRLEASVATALREGGGMLVVLEEGGREHLYSKRLMDPATGLAYEDPSPNTFSFNSPYGACPLCRGMGTIEQILEESVIPDPNLSIAKGGIAPLGLYRNTAMHRQVKAICDRYRCSLNTPIKDLPSAVVKKILYGEEDRQGKFTAGDEGELLTHGVINFLKKHREDPDMSPAHRWADDFTVAQPCPECKGQRLKKESLHIRIENLNIAQLTQMGLPELCDWLVSLDGRLDKRRRIIADAICKEALKRIKFLLEIGLDYLTLDRPLSTLSGGEMQRIRLATQIGTQLVSVLYLLDEPSIGLHARDNVRLIEALKKLRDLGNSVIVVEHDKDMMLNADYIIDMGPGAGKNGGRIVAQGPPKQFLNNESLTTQYLADERSAARPRIPRRPGSGQWLSLQGASGNNLRNVDVAIPLGTLVCVTGVSGSGKSSLVNGTLFPLLSNHFYRTGRRPLPYRAIAGVEHLDKVIQIDQSPIGRTPRSNPATYTKVFSDIRELYAQLPESKIRGYKPGRFSFNVAGGRCEHCGGAGLRLIEMDFLPDVYISCEECKGMRYNRETLEVRFKNKSILDVLNMTVEEACKFFEHLPQITQKLQTLNDVGLGYVTLGQYATTLSGGEAQRVKLATELARRGTGKTFYILDEPTTGLHFQDISHLLDILQKLVDKGNTVLVIEHNMDVIKSADYLIDLGPEGGSRGGEVVALGTPEQVAQSGKGHTALFLRQELLMMHS